MKLYLSSYRLPTPAGLWQLLPVPPEQAKVAIVVNAKDYHPPKERRLKLNELKSDLKKYGLKSAFINLKKYTGASDLKNDLVPYNLLWLAGGNTFILRYEMKRSGFDKAIVELLKAGVVYVGESAGAIVAGITLKGSETADELKLAPRPVWSGLKLVNKIIAPHADSLDFANYIKQMKKIYQNDKRLLLLKDSEAYIYNQGQQYKLGK